MEGEGNAAGGLVGRGVEIEAITAEARRASAGDPRLVVVRGAAGIGKTTLLRAVSDLLTGEGTWTVRRAVAARNQVETEYGVVSQLDRGLWPLLDREGPFVPPAGAGARLVDLLGELQEHGPVALVVDDLHWSDQASLEALLFALRRLQHDRVLTVVACRPDDDRPVPEGFLRLAQLAGLPVDLAGLSVAELTEVAQARGRRLSRTRLAELVARTGGNPLHFTELLDAAWERRGSSDSWLPAPRSLADVGARRRAGLDAAAVALVDAAAVVEGVVRLGDLAAVAGVADAEVTRAADAALRSGLLVAGDDPADLGVRFAHPLSRDAAYELVELPVRARLHAAAARVTTDPAVALRHEVAAARLDPSRWQREARGLRQRVAGRAELDRARGDAVAAAGGFILAASLWDTTADSEDRTVDIAAAAEELRWRAVDAWLLAGNVVEAHRLAERITPGQSPSAWRSYSRGRLAMLQGRPAEAVPLLEEAAELALASEAHTLALDAVGALTNLFVILDRPVETMLWADRIAPLLAAGEPAWYAVSSAALIRWLVEGVDPRRSIVIGEDWPSEAAPAVMLLQLVTTAVGDLDDARRYATMLRARAAMQGGLHWSSSSLAYLADVEYRAGNWDLALTWGAQAAEHAEASEHAWDAALVYAVSSYVWSARGQWDRAAAYVGRVHDSAARTGDVASRLYATIAQARLHHARGAAMELRELCRGWSTTPSSLDEAIEMAGWRELYVEALITTGDLHEARVELERFASAAEARGAKVARAIAARLGGMLASAVADGTAGRSFERSLELLASTGHVFELARTHAAYGAHLLRRDDLRGAQRHLERALAVLVRLDAAPYVARVREDLARVGSPAAVATPLPGRDLTGKELAVARLVSEGLSNKEIATELIVSVKTVEYHLGHVFAKLAVSSRTQLARLMLDRRAAESAPR